MPKNFFQDMVKIKRESREKLQQPTQSPMSSAPLPEEETDEAGAQSIPIHIAPTEEASTEEPTPATYSQPVQTPTQNPFVDSEFASIYDVTERADGRKKSKRTLWIVALVSVVFCFFALSYVFAKATITVTPKTKDVVLNESLSATKDDSSNGLAFSLVAISGEEDKVVQTSATKAVSTSAQGIVRIYNTYSAATQKLDIDTRLEGSNGKIYKTKIATAVPGVNKDGTPGFVQVAIYASEAGADYNSAPLDFKIFGFKGTAKYSKFYARSQNSITGGFKGTASIVSDADKATAVATLKTTLQAKLLKQAADQIPSGFILFKDAVFLNTSDNSSDYILSKDNTVTIKLTGTLYGLLFDEKKLTTKIAQDNIDKYDGAPVYISNMNDLTFSLVNKDTTSFADVKNINFNISGNAKIVWQVDAVKLTSDLLGKSKKEFSATLLQYPNIESANLSLSPIWRFSIPDKAANVKVMVNYPEAI